MTVPSVNYTVLNGRLGVRPPGGVECHAYVGPCSAGTVANPTRHVRVEDMLATYVSGSTPELAARAIAGWKGDVLMVRATAGTAASFETIDTTGVAGNAPTNKPFAASAIDIYRFENGRVVERWGNSDLAGIYQQLGFKVVPR